LPAERIVYTPIFNKLKENKKRDCMRKSVKNNRALPRFAIIACMNAVDAPIVAGCAVPSRAAD
jgi:hypothetical protein